MLENLNKEIISFKETAIMEIANFGRNHEKATGQKVYPAWFGEGDASTSQVICDKSIDALNNGKTFYTYQNGIPELRLQLSKYMNEVFNINTKPEHHSVVNGGMMGLRLVCDLIVNSGDEVVLVGPVWPNIRSSVQTGHCFQIASAFAQTYCTYHTVLYACLDFQHIHLDFENEQGAI